MFISKSALLTKDSCVLFKSSVLLDPENQKQTVNAPALGFSLFDDMQNFRKEGWHVLRLVNEKRQSMIQ
ncbi:MAG: hypothetical protein LKK13_01205 [Bacilli bacterium]|nr:hypothetical protein [Bacilli bacterium]